MKNLDKDSDQSNIFTNKLTLDTKSLLKKNF